MSEEQQHLTPEEWPDFLYQRVPSLYGPGNFACWLLVTVSVFVTWTLNRKHQHSDVLGADFMAMITYPTVAAIDAATKLTHYPFKRGDFHHLATPSNIPSYRRDPEEWLYTEAIRAPIAICVRFCEFGAALFVVMVYWTKPRTMLEMPLKRVLLLSLVWTLCGAVKVAEVHFDPMFTEGKGPPAGQLWILNRYYPALLEGHVENSTRYIIGIVLVSFGQFLACAVSAAVALVYRIMIISKVRPFLNRVRIDEVGVQTRGEFVLSFGGSWALCQVLFLSLARLITFVMGDRQYAPQTTVSMGELDQVAALLGGIVVLAWSLKDAAAAWKHIGKQD